MGGMIFRMRFSLSVPDKRGYRRSGLHSSSATLLSDLFHQRVEGHGYFGFNDATPDRPRLVFPTRDCIENFLVNVGHTRAASEDCIGHSSAFLDLGLNER